MAKKPEGNPANRSVERPDDLRPERRDRFADAASRLDVQHARLGSELSSDPRPRDETETQDALKRTAENEGRP